MGVIFAQAQLVPGLHHAQILARGSQDLTATISNHYGVLDADAAEALQIDTRFDGNRHSGVQARLVAFADARRLVNLEPQAVAGRVYKCPCLLYTSPSPRDRQKSRMPSSA